MTDVTEQGPMAAADDAGDAHGGLAVWGPGLLLLLAAIALVTLAFHQTAVSIVSIWERSETYAHGFLIVPISLWLVWEKRAGLTSLAPRPTALPLVLFLPLGFGWLLGHLVDVLVVQQFAYVGLLVVTIWAVLGHRLARYLAFPILFLFFGVPVGEGLVYPMMNFTADFTVGMLKLTGIPVYREGTFFTIPSGQWSVVEACSGMRYLIASVTLGVLFAYLTYTRWWKRLLFVLFSVFVPVIANGFRAYMIVMIGHLSDMKLAVGVDHLIYGWVFFGIIITIMFVVGSIWRDPAAPPPRARPTVAQPVTSRGALRLLSVLAVCALFWPAAAWALSDHGGEVRPVTVQAPEVSGWSTDPNVSAWDWRPRVVGADGRLYAFYRPEHGSLEQIPPQHTPPQHTPPQHTPPQHTPPQHTPPEHARMVGLFLGVYRTQRHGAELVTSANIMVDEKHPMWSDTMVRPRRVGLSSGELALEQHLLSSRRGERLLVWTWYLVGDRHTSNPYLAKLLEAKSRLLGHRGEAALIAVAAPYDERPETAASVLTSFVDAMLPAIEAEVERALRAES